MNDPYRSAPLPLVAFHRPWLDRFVRRLIVGSESFKRGSLKHGRNCRGELARSYRLPFPVGIFIASLPVTCGHCKRVRKGDAPFDKKEFTSCVLLSHAGLDAIVERFEGIEQLERDVDDFLARER